MTGWELRIWRKSMLWSREKAAREFGVTQRTWHAWENAERKRKLTAVCSHQTRIGNLDAHLI